MRQSQLPLTALPAWAKLNDVNFYDVSVQYHHGKGYGLVASRALSSQDTFDTPVLLNIPESLILGTDALNEYSRADKHFRELREAVGFTVPRQEIMLYLLLQLTMCSPDTKEPIGVSGPWTEYARMLPERVPVPTTWTESQREMLIGTSLESLVDSKIAALTRQYDKLCENAKNLTWCQKIWFESSILQLQDWIHVDALYRSRCLEIPESGECMIPCIDMANHSVEPNSFYDRSKSGNEIVLQIGPDHKVESGEEITITYGEVKSAAEMLFSYGFIDSHISSTTEVVLNLEPVSGDPLGEAKLFSFPGAPSVKITDDEDGLRWSSPFLHLMCLNEEDGLEFKVPQQTDGTIGELQTFFDGLDVSDKTAAFEELTATHPLADVFTLRCVAILQDIVQHQIERLYASENLANSLGSLPENVDISAPALHLRVLETTLLERSFVMLDDQKNELVKIPAVQSYLGISSSNSEQPSDNQVPELPGVTAEPTPEEDYS